MATTNRKRGAIPLTNEQILGKYPEVVRRLERHELGREIEAATGLSRPTIRRVRRAMQAGGWVAPSRERKPVVVTMACQKGIARLLDQGASLVRITAELGISHAVAAHARQKRMATGWTPVTVRETMTPADRLEKYPDVVAALLSGATYRSAAEAGGVSINVVRTVARNLKALGRWLA